MNHVQWSLAGPARVVGAGPSVSSSGANITRPTGKDGRDVRGAAGNPARISDSERAARRRLAAAAADRRASIGGGGARAAPVCEKRRYGEDNGPSPTLQNPQQRSRFAADAGAEKTPE
jgi:hypothetical protein